MVCTLTCNREQQKSATLGGALFFFLSIVSLVATAQEMKFNNEISLGVSALRFDNREYGTSGQLLDRELGGIAGITGRMARRETNWEWETAGSFHYGPVTYTGQLQNGVPANTTTVEALGDVSFRTGYWFDNFMPYVGLGYHLWNRDIRAGVATNGSSFNGMYEEYRWFYLALGSKWLAYKDRADSRLYVDIALLQPAQNSLDVTVGTSKVQLKPEGKIGYRLALSYQTELGPQWTMTTTPYAEQWKFDQSPTVNGWYEPEALTRNFGLEMRLNWRH